jgi:NAD(P)H dehydrogenase (quinone)
MPGIMIRMIVTPLFLLLAICANAQTNVLIVYHSESGHTAALAAAVEDGARSVGGTNTVIKSTHETTNKDLLWADAIIVGSPVHNANVTPEISRFIASWPFENEPLKNKIGAAFVTAGGISAGEEIVQMSILKSMLIFGMIVVGGTDWTQPFGASAITGEPPFNLEESGEVDEHFREKGRKLGERVAEVAIKMRAD